MYHAFYGLARMPFQGSPDPDFLYPGPAHQEALATLEYGVDSGSGFVMVTGDIGMGKTTLIRTFLRRAVRPDMFIIYVFHPLLTFRALLAVIAEELGLPIDEPEPHQLLRQIQRDLIARFEVGQRVVLIIDEAQRLPEETLDNLRLVSNLETDESKLLQIVLVGQTELDALIASKRLRALDQRISRRARLTRLAPGDAEAYVRHRLRQAGAAEPEEVISASAIRLIAKQSGGVPRRINALADLALSRGFGAGERPVSRRSVMAARQGPNLPAFALPVMPDFGAMLRSGKSISAALGMAALVAAIFVGVRLSGPPPATSGSFPAGEELAYVVSQPESIAALANRLYGTHAPQAMLEISRNNPGLDAQSVLSNGQVLFLPMPAASP
jgi:type II secretory pathway predicted ATPase ExeA